MFSLHPVGPERPDLDSALFFLLGVLLSASLVALAYVLFGDVVGDFIHWYAIGPE